MKTLLIIATLLTPLFVNTFARADEDTQTTKKSSTKSKKTKKHSDGSKTTTEKTETKTEKSTDTAPAANP